MSITQIVSRRPDVEGDRESTSTRTLVAVKNAKPLRRGLTRVDWLLAGAFVAVTVFSVLLGVSAIFPEEWRVPLGEWAESFTNWFVDNLAFAYEPVTASLDGLMAWVLYGLYLAPPILLSVVFIAIAWRAAGVWIAALTAGTIVLTVSFGLWEPMQETLALMIVAVVASTALGLVIGVLGSLNRRAGAVVRTVLDAMQTFPMFGYLVPALVIFGPGTAAALVVTIIWATPPIARLTMVGINGIAVETVEAADSQGVSRWQRLRKVQLPLALPSIRAGLNQTIMFAMAMAIIASMIGAGGLGDPVWVRLRLLQFGPAMEAGIILVLIAIVLDRTTSGDHRRPLALERGKRPIARWPLIGAIYKRGPAVFGGVVAGLVVVLAGLMNALNLRFLDFAAPPAWFSFSIGSGVDAAVDWLNVTLGGFFDAFSYLVQTFMINPVVDSLASMPWTAALCAVFVVGYVAIGWKGGVLSALGASLIGLLGMWVPASYTLGFVGVATIVTLVIGIPLGILASQSSAFAAVLRPVLDAMQTLPVFLFVIPSVVLFGPGPVAGLLATVAYAIPPVIRLTNLAIRRTDPEIIEAAVIFGTNSSQILRKVRIPLGTPTILVGLNQAVMLALSMAVISSFVGTPGLGREILLSISDGDLALAVQAGVAMYLLATICDRVLQSGFQKLVPGSAQVK